MPTDAAQTHACLRAYVRTIVRGGTGRPAAERTQARTRVGRAGMGWRVRYVLQGLHYTPRSCRCMRCRRATGTACQECMWFCLLMRCSFEIDRRPQSTHPTLKQMTLAALEALSGTRRRTDAVCLHAARVCVLPSRPCRAVTGRPAACRTDALEPLPAGEPSLPPSR
jgi:hypothetical protein